MGAGEGECNWCQISCDTNASNSIGAYQNNNIEMSLNRFISYNFASEWIDVYLTEHLAASKFHEYFRQKIIAPNFESNVT